MLLIELLLGNRDLPAAGGAALNLQHIGADAREVELARGQIMNVAAKDVGGLGGAVQDLVETVEHKVVGLGVLVDEDGDLSRKKKD